MSNQKARVPEIESPLHPALFSPRQSSTPSLSIMTETFQAYPNRNVFNLDPVVQKHLVRVYSALATGLASAAVAAFLTLSLHSGHNNWLSVLSAILLLPSFFMFRFLPSHSPYRSISFHAFAFINGCSTAPLLSIVAEVDPRIPPLALLASATVFACCSLSALFAKRGSYLYLSSFLFTGLTGLCLVSLINFFWRDLLPFASLLFMGLLLFCGFVLYDTQVIIEKAHRGERDHLQHALDLLIDFFAIFRRVMLIMAGNQRKRNERNNNRNKRECTQ